LVTSISDFWKAGTGTPAFFIGNVLSAVMGQRWIKRFRVLSSRHENRHQWRL